MRTARVPTVRTPISQLRCRRHQPLYPVGDELRRLRDRDPAAAVAHEHDDAKAAFEDVVGYRFAGLLVPDAGRNVWSVTWQRRCVSDVPELLQALTDACPR